eukprot:72953-Prorocentrum_minimum.AAC.1
MSLRRWANVPPPPCSDFRTSRTFALLVTASDARSLPPCADGFALLVNFWPLLVTASDARSFPPCADGVDRITTRAQHCD